MNPRLFDVGFALAGLSVLGPVMAALAAAIRLEDGGPMLFRQERIGRGGEPFCVLKLRSMRDGEITRVGRLVRRTGLDETAQFLNVLMGDMSMVGPRPLTADDLERLGWTGRDGRFTVRPGITGLAQVFGGQGRQASEALEAAWLRQHHPRMDVELIVLSFAVNLGGKHRIRRWLMTPRARLLRAAALGQRTLSRRHAEC